ncbi:uncharacterized protein LTR77_001880 [Saxophila tyrrhenica]|uniref:Amidohydrolase-related domain-containing protein n=1 Tax=Saxophila tyrrhenica TaxID=1690608 RepID=A0AAV9PND8_9PEZI|nr:hypothetical protein LTR77_001880 [Saxophila tyrrhenica]
MVMKPTCNGSFTIHTSLLFDPKTKSFLKDISLTISPDSGLITSLSKRTSPLPTTISPPDIDLRHRTVLPGLVDAHTHILLHSYRETPSLNQMRDESLPERIIRATNHCRTALLAGYTTYRDLGTEGAGDADVHVRDAVNRGIIPGPRIFAATECLASSGGYETRIESRSAGVEVPRISDPVDGVVGCKAGVRRRLGAGADVVKFYADYRKRALRWPGQTWPGCAGIEFPPEQTEWLTGERNPNLLLFGQEEMDAMVSEAKAARAPVAAHASSAEAVAMAAMAGVTTVEHGFESWEGSEVVAIMKEKGTIWVPTLAVIEAEAERALEGVLKQVKRAWEAGVRIAAGGDTGAFAHGENVREVELLLRAGLPLEEALTAATLRGWEACGGEWAGRKFGWLGEGCAADVVALEGDVREDVGALRRVEFVMKDGRVWKREGEAVGMV